LWYVSFVLRWVRVENVAVIESLEVEFSAGLNILTGETGAGKSILVDALGVILGDKASSELIRTGADSAVVEAGFELAPVPEALAERLAEAGVDPDEQIVVRRELSRGGGRGKVIVNSSAGSRTLLRDMAPHLVDIHGQGENLSLLRPEAALDLLDTFGGSWTLRNRVGEAFVAIAAVEQELTAETRRNAERAAQKEFTEFVFAELDKAELRAGEDEELDRERGLAAHAEKLKTLSDGLFHRLYEDEDSVLARLASVFKQVDELSEIDAHWKSYSRGKDAVTGPLEDLALSLRDYADGIDVTEGKLDVVESRLSLLERLKKKHGGTLEAVIDKREQCRRDLAALEDTNERLDALRAERDARRQKYDALAQELSRMRRNASGRLEKAVVGELPSLALPKARFRVGLEVSEARESGTDGAELLFSANPGEDLKPLAKVASGGELSRFMLALKSVAAKDDLAKVLVFDEVDAGIGGRVAEAVGDKLGELARLHQVICVTHLPQIASFAPAHYRIDKMESKGRIETRITRLDEDAHIEEIARMLAGAVVTESAREHARQLVEAHDGHRAPQGKKR